MASAFDLKPIQKGYKPLEAEYKRLEPEISSSKQGENSEIEAICNVWRGRWDSNPRPPA